MPDESSWQDLRDLYHDYTGRYTGEFQVVEAFQSMPVNWESKDDELEGFLNFLDIFSFADIEPGHDKAYWDELKELFSEVYGVTDEGIDWDLLRSAYEASKG